jgi:hypothetical protein
MFKVDFKEENPRESVITSDIDYLKEPDFVCVIGSKLYGTDGPDSDLDIRGFTFMPKEFLLGIKRFEQHDPPVSKESDVVIWNVEKFIKMLLNGSSVAFEMLFCPDNLIIRKSKAAHAILEQKTLFISQRVIKSALGYAQSEWRKVKGDVTRDLGARRKEHIKEKGYSYRNASHAIRILDLYCDLADYGMMKFPVTGSAFIKAVKEGNVPFKDVEGIYTRALDKLEKKLPDVPKKQKSEKINDLLVRLNLKRLLIAELGSIYDL